MLKVDLSALPDGEREGVEFSQDALCDIIRNMQQRTNRLLGDIRKYHFRENLATGREVVPEDNVYALIALDECEWLLGEVDKLKRAIDKIAAEQNTYMIDMGYTSDNQ